MMDNWVPSALDIWASNSAGGGPRLSRGPIASPMVDVDAAMEDRRLDDVCCTGSSVTDPAP
jgi:hypothetical protein